MTIVELVQGEELDVLVDDDGEPGAVDAVATIFTRQSGLLGLKQDPKTKSIKISFPSKVFASSGVHFQQLSPS